MKILSCGSSTLYCLAPIVKVLEDNYGVEEGFVTSIHAMTPSLKPLDGLCLKGKHWRDHRSITQNIIPAATGACKALGRVIPAVKDRLCGLAFRVPIANVSVLDICIKLKKFTSILSIAEDIDKFKKSLSQTIIKTNTDEVVSSDFIGDPYSCVLDVCSSIQLKPNSFKLVCWYENEYSYACRVLDLILISEAQFKNLHVDTDKCFCSRPELTNKHDVSQTIGDTTLRVQPRHAGPTLRMPAHSAPPSKAHFLNEPLSVNKPALKCRTSLIKAWEDTEINSGKNCPVYYRSHNVLPFELIDTRTKAHARLAMVRQEFSKMVNITENLLKKSCKSIDSCRSEDEREQNDSKGESKTEDLKKGPIKNIEEDANKWSSDEIEVKHANDSSSDKIKIKHANGASSDEIKIKQANDSSSGETEIRPIVYSSSSDEIKIKPANDSSSDEIEIRSIILSEGNKKSNATIGSRHMTTITGCSFEGSQSMCGAAYDSQYSFPSSSKNTNSQRLQSADAETMKNKLENLNREKLLQHLIFTSRFMPTTALNSMFSGMCNSLQNKFLQNKKNKAGSERNVTTTGSSTPDDIDLPHIKEKEVKLQSAPEQAPVLLKVLLTVPSKRHTKENKIRCENTMAERKAANIAEDLNKSSHNVLKIFDDERSQASGDFGTDEIESKSNEGTTDNSEAGSECLPEAEALVDARGAAPSPRPQQDIFDKLDSASDTESDNSFETNRKKSQVIAISDLTASLEDLERLDKMCRIMEISDELSDKLLSPLNQNPPDLVCVKEDKKWSFKDLCEKVNLDEFCNKVFGN